MAGLPRAVQNLKPRLLMKALFKAVPQLPGLIGPSPLFFSTLEEWKPYRQCCTLSQPAEFCMAYFVQNAWKQPENMTMGSRGVFLDHLPSQPELSARLKQELRTHAHR